MASYKIEKLINNMNCCKRIFIRKTCIGNIIGKQGSKIKELMEKGNCSIKVENKKINDIEREVIIIGKKRGILIILKEIKNILNCEFQQKLFCAPQLSTGLIGLFGQNINRIRDESKAKIQIHDYLRNSTLITLQEISIFGSEKEIYNALNKIINCIVL